MSYINILEEHPYNSVLNLNNRSATDKEWAERYNFIKADRSRLRTSLDASGALVPDWFPLIPMLSDDATRRQEVSLRTNTRYLYVLDSEEDGVGYFLTEIVSPVLAKFVHLPGITYHSFGSHNGVIVDCAFQWGGRRIAIGEYKRNIINVDAWYNSTFDRIPGQNKLTRELRGYAMEYECPQVFCFDINCLVLLQFRAKKLDDMKDCDVDYWVFPRREAHDTVPGYPLRDALYRLLVQGIRRLQNENLPPPTIGSETSCGRAFYSGEPLWRHADGKKHRFQPDGYERDAEENGQLLWKRDGQWYIDEEGRSLGFSHFGEIALVCFDVRIKLCSSFFAPNFSSLSVMASSHSFEFQWKSQTLCGRGGPICLPSHEYANIIRLSLAGGTIQELPNKIILKMQGERHDLFQTEQMFYEKEKGLQELGLVPQYHGLASIGGTPALVLSDLGGTMIHDNPSLAQDENTLRDKLTELLGAIRRAGVVHEDITVLNVLHCDDGRFRLVDFKEAEMNQSIDEDKIEDEVAVQVSDLVLIMKLRYEARMKLQEWESRNKHATPIQYESLLRHNLSSAVNAVDIRGSVLAKDGFINCVRGS
ncbi:hypothetical protein TOPH_07337 [Tolypocladium ophioglossoides CBS 100239]|uniref:Protein kinase domain-containing protein n=1 Tax=Tolypocladium ophioglossoides (strain CBS 100239) TaxID=1163406 RepID=A0A0L0N1U9_TOLOC|nr:hypothetical protein TOPH_07337 [Tolypocladium ophioglossoides CBS 100239]